MRFEERQKSLQQSLQQLPRCRRTAAYMKIDGNDGIDSARDRIAAGEYAAVGRAIADRDHPLWVGVAW